MQETEKSSSTVVDVTFKAKRFDLTSGHLANEIDFTTKMSKANKGCCGCGDENFNVTIEPSGEDCPIVFVNHYDKTTKVETGATEKVG